MKKYLVMLMVTMMTMSMTACGTSVPTGSSPAEDSADYIGEGETQGGMPTDKELEAREAEAESYEEEPSEDYSDANVEMETTPTASDTFISSDNFWNGDDYFDLEEYYWMNGANDVTWSTGNEYTPVANFNGWEIRINGNGCRAYNLEEYYNSNPAKMYYFYGDDGLSRKVSITQSGPATIQVSILPVLDEIIPCLRENYTEKDPFVNCNLEYSYN